MTNAERVQRALTELGPEAFLTALGVRKLVRAGNARRARCPIHGGGDINFAVWVSRGGLLRWKCHSVCQRGGDAIELVAALRGYNLPDQFTEVLRETASIAGVELIDEPKPWNQRTESAWRVTVPHGPSAEDLAKERATLREQRERFGKLFAAGELYGEAIGYLASRGLKHPQRGYAAAIAFGVCVLPENAEEELARRFAGNRLLFPMHDEHGIPWFQGRALGNVDKAKRWMSPYGLSAGLFNGHALQQKPKAQVILCEGPTDTLSLCVWAAELAQQCGEFVAVGKAGTGPLKPSQAQMLEHRAVWVAYDGDRAGERGAAEVVRTLFEGGASEVRRLPVPLEMDVNDWVRVLYCQGDAA